MINLDICNMDEIEIVTSHRGGNIDIDFRSRYPINDGYQHEGLDRVSTIQSLMEDRLGYPDPDGNPLHPSIWNDKCENLLKNAFDNMAELYQHIGRWDPELNPHKPEQAIASKELFDAIGKATQKFMYMPNTESTQDLVKDAIHKVVNEFQENFKKNGDCMIKEEIREPEKKYVWMKVENTTFIIRENYTQFKHGHQLYQHSEFVYNDSGKIIKCRQDKDWVITNGGIETLYPKYDGKIFTVNESTLKVLYEIVKAGGSLTCFLEQFHDNEMFQEVFDTFNRNNITVKFDERKAKLKESRSDKEEHFPWDTI